MEEEKICANLAKQDEQNAGDPAEEEEETPKVAHARADSDSDDE
jgi:hypothetical protein